jgi:dTDP-4-amino-4,6-dideoxygalactose transaminase
MKVPYLDLKRQYLTIKDEINNAIQSTIDSCAFVAGDKVRKFEENFAAYCGTKYAIGVSCGTSALYVALRTMGMGKGDIIITVPYTFIATVEAITMTGARPVFIDIEKDSYNISIAKLKQYVEKSCTRNASDNTLVDKQTGLTVRVIIPVHLYGQMSDMDEIMAIAQEYNLLVLEDAAQAHGAVYKDQKAGTIGQIGIFSFYPSKNLGAFGQGGAVLTSDERIAERARQFINHGQTGKYAHAFEGWNFKMDGFQAAILDTKLKHLDVWNQARQKNAEQYRGLLSGLDGIVLPANMPDRDHVYHLFVIRVEDRSSLQGYLKQQGIGFTVAYPVPLHMQGAYKHLGYAQGDFPNAEKCAEGVIALPIFPELTEKEITQVGATINAWVQSTK